MSTVDGADCCSFWSNKIVDAFDGTPFHLTPFMSCRHFDNPLQHRIHKGGPTPVLQSFLGGMNHVANVKQQHGNNFFAELDQLH